jgi:hypothetical protein
MVVGVAAVVAMRRGAVDVPERVAVVDYRQRLDELAGRIRDKREVIDGLLASEQRADLAKEMAVYVRSPGMALDADRDRAAGALLVYAAEMRRRVGGEHEAGREYRRVIELFPDSPLALAAREGLKGIEN